MKIAVEGCCHGELDLIYQHIQTFEARNSCKIDLLLICGDFQAIRNHQDLQCMAVPQKYRRLGGFHKYYTGETIAPVLTLVIGGNHEASNYLWELYHGGWLAPKIYYLGHSGCVNVNGIRIAGASGIFKENDYRQGHWERLPYTDSAMRSAYHIRDYDVHKLSLLNSPTIVLSHDWPRAVEHHGNLPYLLKQKPFFKADIESGRLGSPPLMALMSTLKPEWWFSAHLHVRFEATVYHSNSAPDLPDQQSVAVLPVAADNPDEIVIEDMEGDDEITFARPVSTGESYAASMPEYGAPLGTYTRGSSSAPSRNPRWHVSPSERGNSTTEGIRENAGSPRPQHTRFLALDKCVPGRKFLEVIDIDTSELYGAGEPSLVYDSEWLAITRALHPFLSTSREQRRMPGKQEVQDLVQQELLWVQENIGGAKSIAEVQQFLPTAPGPGSEGPDKMRQPPWYTNPQTEAFCSMLGLRNRINPPPGD